MMSSQQLNQLVLLSDESAKIIYIDYASKKITQVIELESKEQHEALSFSADFSTTLVGSEPYFLLKVNKANTTQFAH